MYLKKDKNLINKNVPINKIACIPNWVDVNFIRPLPKKAKNWKNIHQLNDKFVVLYSGNIALTQGLETVIETAASLRHIPEIAFVIAGESKALKRLQKHCLACGANNVLLLPLQPREKLPEMLAAADIGLVVQKRNVISFNMPSKIPLLLASGSPIIASVPLSGTAARAVRQSGGGVVISPESPQDLATAIMSLYSNPVKAAKFSQKARNFAVEHYSFEQALMAYEAVFYQAIYRNIPRVLPAIEKELGVKS